MARKITSIKVTNEAIEVYEKRTIPITWLADKENVEQRNPEQAKWMVDNFYTHLLYGFAGYGFAKKLTLMEKDTWKAVDIKERHPDRLRPDLTRKELNTIIRGMVISENEWLPKHNEIPVRISNDLLKGVK